MTDEELQQRLIERIHNYMIDAGFKKNMYKIKTYAKRIYGELFGLTAEEVRFVVDDIKTSKFNDELNVVKHMFKPHQYSLIFTFEEDNDRRS